MSRKCCVSWRPYVALGVMVAGLSLSPVVGVGLAQLPDDPNAPADLPIPPGFDVDVIGYHALGVDFRALRLSYLPIDWQIARTREQIARLRQILQLLEGRSNDPRQDVDGFIARSTATEAIPQRRIDLAVAEAHLEWLLREREQLRRPTDAEDCDTDGKVAAWRATIRESQRVIDIVAPTRGQSTWADQEIANHTSLIQEARGYVASLMAACQGRQRQRAWDDVQAAIPQVIKNAQNELAEARIVARRGRFADLPGLRERLSRALSDARTLELLGDKAGNALFATAMEIVQEFSNRAAANCAEESFAYREALGVQQQNGRLGIDIDLMHCAYRLFETAQVNGMTPAWQWRFCGLWHPGQARPTGEWKMRMRTVMRADGGGVSVDGAGQYVAAGEYVSVSTGSFRMEGTFNTRDQVLRDQLGREESGWSLGTSRRWITWTGTVLPHRVRVGRGSEIPVQGGPIDTVELQVTIINDNKPCNPSRDVWSY